MKMHLFLIFIISFILLSGITFASAPSSGLIPDFPNLLNTQSMPSLLTTSTASQLTKITDIGGRTNTIIFKDYYVCANEGRNLVIIDLSDPTTPQLMSKLQLGESFITNIFVSGEMALVCTEFSGAYIIDLTNPYAPVIIGHISAIGIVYETYFAGNYAYLAEGENGFNIYDITNPEQPQTVYHNADSTYNIRINGAYCYTCSGSKITELNINNPASPQIITEFKLGFDNARMLYLHNNLIYVQGYHELRIYDISNPATLHQTGSFSFPSDPWDLKVNGNLAYIIVGGDYFSILNISNPANPQLVSQQVNYYRSIQLAVTGDLVLLACWENNIQVYNCSDPANPALISTWVGVAPVAKSITIDKNKAFIAERMGGMAIVDISNPAVPQLIDKYTNNLKSCDAVAVKDNIVLLAETDILHIFDYSNPAVLLHLADFPVPTGEITDILIDGSTAWLAANYAGFVALDISDPTHPVQISKVDTPGYAKNLAISGSYLWVADYLFGLRGYNISTPSNPQEIAFIPTLSKSRDIVISGNYAYVIQDDNSKIHIVDISAPLSPGVVDSVNTELIDPYSVHIQNNILFIAGYKGIQGFDISNPTQPVETIPFCKISTKINNIAANNEFLFAANDGMGLEIYKLPGSPVVSGIIVTNTNDLGAGSLRQALEQAYSETGPDTIRFNIPATDPNYNAATGVWTIKPASQLSSINDEIVIEGNSQADFIAEDTNPDGPEIQIDGSLLPSCPCLIVNADNCEFSGLAIINFQRAAINASHVNGLKVWGCYLGLDATGAAAAPNMYGILLSSNCTNAFIGPLEDFMSPNVISGNSEAGVYLVQNASNNTVYRNIIGLDPQAAVKIGNAVAGIALGDQSINNIIAENIIAGNKDGISIADCIENQIQNNTIGANKEFAANLGNTEYGIFITGSAERNMVYENFIWYNGLNGILILGQNCVTNTINRNSIAFNTEPGIDLRYGGNANMQPPGQLQITGATLSGVTLPKAVVELFCDQNNQGQNFLMDTYADQYGVFSFSLPAEPLLPYYTLTATDTLGNTSAFTAPIPTVISESVQEKLPTRFTVEQNYPNPFNPVTTIRYGLPAADVVTVKVFDILGKEILTLVNAKKQPAGWHNLEFDASDLATGLYFYQVITTRSKGSGKMILVR